MSIGVLVADDHVVVRTGLQSLLSHQADIAVLGEAANGLEAIQQVKKLKPDVMIVDLAMPVLNGIEAVREARRISPLTKAVILSMHDAEEHVFRALEAGALGYVLKEDAGTEIVRAVREVHSGQRFLSERIETMVLAASGRVGDARVPDERLAALSHRERQVLQLVVEGKTSACIARQLLLSRKTVETYRSRLMAKLRIHSIPDLVRLAIQEGMIQLK